MSEAKEAELERSAGRPIQLLQPLQHLALAIAGQSMFSLEMAGFGAELRAMLLRYARHHAKVGALDLLLPPSLPTPPYFGRARFRTEWLRLMDRIIDAREHQDSTEDQPRDLFDLLATARDPETGAGFGRAQLRDEVSTMILAGHEMTAVALFWACYIAARLPEHQERIAAEAAAADLSADNAAASVRALPFTRAHVDETLRLYPPAFLIVRQALGPDTILGGAASAGAAE